MKSLILLSAISFLSLNHGMSQTYPIVDTKVTDNYDNSAIISPPTAGQAFHGQDASYAGNQPSYTDNADGTITDNVTGLMWQQDMGSKITYTAAFTKASNLGLGGHNDWRVPTIKELYSLAQFTGRCNGDYVIYKFIDTNYFNQPIGNTANPGEREIDAQTWSSTQYVGLTMMGDTTVFGYNFVDGRLKGYPKFDPQSGNPNSMYFRMVRGSATYGVNDFVDNADGTITDNATGLMWQQADDGTTRDWENALSYSEGLTLAGYSDWRLPNAKELQSILDYTRCPSETSSPAIDPLFTCTSFNDPDGNPGQYGYYWTGSPLMDGPTPYTDAVYICFGEAQGEMESPPNSGTFVLMDTHGAGAQRNDPKTGVQASYPQYFGPQNDVQYVFNYVRAVRGGVAVASLEEDSKSSLNIYPNPANDQFIIASESTFRSVVIYNLIGELIMTVVPTTNKVIINTADFPNGVYVIEAVSENGNTVNSKITVAK